MANAPATGNGPFEFTDSLGRQVSIPLTAFSVDPVKGIVPDAAWAATFSSSPPTAVPASALLAYAIKHQSISPAPTPAAVPAMIVKAADAGTGGNNITVQIVAGAPNTDPSLTTFNIVVAEQDTYTGLTAATVASVLGTCNAAGNPVTTGSSPGLVQVLQSSDVGIGSPVAVNALLSGTPASVDVDGTGSPSVVFTLVAKKSGAAGALTKIQVTPDVVSPQVGLETFTLVASWQKEVDGVTIATLQSEVQSALGYEITVSTPVSGAYSVPAASKVSLSGGATGVAASAPIFTGV